VGVAAVLVGTLAPLRNPLGVEVAPDEPPVAVESVSADGLRVLLSNLEAPASLSTAPRPVDGNAWVRLPYKPRPSIIDAAVALVCEAEDPNIVVPLASDDELDRVVAELSSVVHDAAEHRQHIVCFLSGVPGSGKTLVGLRLTHDPDIRTKLVGGGTAPLYLSGNGPLVNVLTEALARDHLIRNPAEKAARARRHAHSLIRLVHSFTKDYGSDPTRRPECRVVVFDEAQRAWDEQQMVSKGAAPKNAPITEPEMLLQIMEREPWAVVIALVGNGQEINSGEAGMANWFTAISNRNALGTEWTAFAAKDGPGGGTHTTRRDSLHLTTSRRAQGLADAAEWVDAVLECRFADARAVLSSTTMFTVKVTRDLTTARNWLRSFERRYRPGLVASSRAARLRAYGIEINRQFLDTINWADWFLDLPPRVTSSYSLEIPATEFKCQGLELDNVGMCWGWDLVPAKARDAWLARRFDTHWNRWNNVKSPDRRRFALNSYRVLLTRARRGMVIWVPPGDATDSTTSPKDMDLVADVLKASGALPI
jgi:DUF2075 family protein